MKKILLLVFVAVVLVEVSAEFQCPPSSHGQLKNPEDCYSYYVCINEEAFLIDCMPGTKWDDGTGRCILEMFAQCKL